MAMKDDGGPAFPNTNHSEIRDGMTLRDWFAGQVLAHSITWGGVDGIAIRAYDIADAMLEARSKK